ncbi:hypothetical protein GCM10010399_72320 [Dactylosporangium fulvum]|uniref:Uncharacterized protein n=1 Tax=Dactylosporangium fulvum TaxID=53359 RepID=A0ABY5W1W6_9ACTN|nr:hypothetical protein [Dactylosporangium fulvum]UWP82061.1 hypothetical protein Dfulv_44515 [Dactylosporangium fulvum]
MRDKMLGRWVFRLAVTMGVSVAALGVSALSAQAADASSARFTSVSGVVTIIGGTPIGQQDHLFVTEDYSWD